MLAQNIHEQDSRRARLKRAAKIWLVVIFMLLRLADVGLVFFAWHPVNPWPLLCGLVIGSMLWTSILIVFVWNRRSWARYALATVMLLVIASFSLALLTLTSNWVPQDLPPTCVAGAAIGLYTLCLVPLGRSAAIHRLATPLGGAQK
jgi:hypothetical protein